MIDLSVKPEDWTFSSVWNLRLGRLAQVNDIYEADRLAEIAKVLLNTSFIGVTDRLETRSRCLQPIYRQKAVIMSFCISSRTAPKIT